MRVFALVVAALAIGRSEAADAADLSIDVEPAVLVAPSPVRLSAKSISEDPIVSYRWTGLPNAPRCREERCAITVPIASCTSVQLEAVTVLGETLTATRALCAADPDGGHPPQLELEVDGKKITAKVQGGSSPIAVMRGYVDGAAIEDDPLEATIDAEDGCHAVDFFVADTAGRIAIAQHLSCLDDDAPQLWIGGKPSSWVPVGDPLQRCAEAAHPLGLAVTLTGGEVALNGCTDAKDAPRSIEHTFISGSDPRRVESFASAFFAATPASGPPVLFFAEAPETLSATQQKPLAFSIDVYGGVAPFTVSGAPARAIVLPSGRVSIEIDAIVRPLGEDELPLTIQDSRGLAAEIAPLLKVSAPVMMMPNNPSPGLSSDAAACVCVSAENRANTWVLILGLVVLSRRRKR